MPRDVTEDRSLCKESGRCLLVVFQTRIALALVDKCPGEECLLGG